MIQISKQQKESQSQEKLPETKCLLYAQQAYSDKHNCQLSLPTHALLGCLLVRSVLKTLQDYAVLNKVTGLQQLH